LIRAGTSHPALLVIIKKREDNKNKRGILCGLRKVSIIGVLKIIGLTY
jgi:hypothetical protein